MEIEEAVYRGFNIASVEGWCLWLWHSMMEEYGYATVGIEDHAAGVAERGVDPWDKITLGGVGWIG